MRLSCAQMELGDTTRALRRYAYAAVEAGREHRDIWNGPWARVEVAPGECPGSISANALARGLGQVVVPAGIGVNSCFHVIKCGPEPPLNAAAGSEATTFVPPPPPVSMSSAAGSLPDAVPIVGVSSGPGGSAASAAPQAQGVAAHPELELVLVQAQELRLMGAAEVEV